MTLPNTRGLRLSASLLVLMAVGGCPGSAETEHLYYSTAMHGRTFGYQEAVITHVEADGRPSILLEVEGRNLLSALGADFDTEVRSEYRLEPETFRLVSAEELVEQGTFKLRISASVEGSTARITVEPGGSAKEVALGPEVIFENPVMFPHLLRDFGAGGRETRRYRVLDLLDRKVRDVTYTKRGTEEVELAGRTFRAIVLDSLVGEIGLKLRLWIDGESGLLLKAEGPRSVLVRAGKSVRSEPVRADLDAHLFAKAGAMIADIGAISYLKAKAVLEPVGSWVTPESLNVRGQSFVGTVEDNRVDGVFEIRHLRYDGKNAPPFPPSFASRPELEPFLMPEDFIEADDPVLVGKARDISAGAADAWEAAKRLSRWVAENIGYDIPGGASARNTYDIREGECGAHSRLMAAFCRGVGIPARVVWGCMYVPNLEGSFGQHAWSEVYMGEAGWIPVDTTAREVDYADSGHIRLGVLSSAHIAWNPKRMEILDFIAGAQKFGAAPPPAGPDIYGPYLGEFNGPRGIITVFVQDGGLAIKLADGRTFGLRDPDEEGRWILKLTEDVHVAFEKEESGRVTGFVLLNKVRLPKRADAEEIPGDVPGGLRTYVGRYPLPMSKREIVISHQSGRLTFLFPDNPVQPLEGPDEAGLWRTAKGEDRYSFIKDEDGTVRALILHEKVRCTRVK